MSRFKTEILRKLWEENTPYRIDSTNTDDTYLRNHLRLNVISEFERINPEYRKNMASFMAYMTELGEFIDTQVREFLGKKSSFESSPPAPLPEGEGRDMPKEYNSFQVQHFQALTPFLKREVIRYLYQQANNGTIGLSE